MGHKTVPFRSTEHLSEEAISVYVDGVMPNYVRMRAEQHLRQCPECRALVEQQRQARARLQQANKPLSTPHSLVRKLHAIPANDEVLRKIATSEGYAAATHYAEDNNMVSSLHTIAQKEEIREGWRAVGAHIRMRVRHFTQGISLKWQSGFRSG